MPGADRFWLLDCLGLDSDPVHSNTVQTATALYRAAVAPPLLARVHVFARRCTTSEAQLHVLALAGGGGAGGEGTYEVREGFTEVARSEGLVEVGGGLCFSVCDFAYAAGAVCLIDTLIPCFIISFMYLL